MKLPISIAPRAEKDLVGIWQYSNGNWGEEQADFYLSQLNSGIELISDNPMIGIDYSHVRIGYRKFQVEKHNVFYVPKKIELVVVRVLHISMDAESELQ